MVTKKLDEGTAGSGVGKIESDGSGALLVMVLTVGNVVGDFYGCCRRRGWMLVVDGKRGRDFVRGATINNTRRRASQSHGAYGGNDAHLEPIPWARSIR